MSYRCETHNQIVNISTGIDGGPTYGHGELDPNGYWDIMCEDGDKHFAQLTKDLAEMDRKRAEAEAAADQNDRWIAKYSGV